MSCSTVFAGGLYGPGVIFAHLLVQGAAMDEVSFSAELNRRGTAFSSAITTIL